MPETDPRPLPPDAWYGIPEPPEMREPSIAFDARYLAAAAGDRRDWSHGPLGLAELHARGVTGKGVRVAVLDTGVDDAHPDLAAVVEDAAGRDFTGSPAGWRDRQSHGTHCAGIVACDDDGGGLVGVAPDATVLPVKVLGDGGSGASSWIAAGIRHAVDVGRADVVSMSLGGPGPDAATRAAVQYAASRGVVVVAAAGNEGPGSVNYPGAYPEVCCVAATGKDGRVARFSSQNATVDVAAPGVDILSAVPGNRYAAYSGTSMATPCVAGVVALGLGELKRLGRPAPAPAAVLAALKATARDVAPPGPDHATGAGLIDPAAFVAALVGPAEPPPPPAPGKTVVVTSPELLAAGVADLTVRFR